MHVFEMIVWVVGLSMIGGVVIAYFESKKVSIKKGGLSQMLGDEYLAKKDILEKFRAMEQRIQVLERIATDKGVTLASEIDNLK